MVFVPKLFQNCWTSLSTVPEKLPLFSFSNICGCCTPKCVKNVHLQEQWSKIHSTSGQAPKSISIALVNVHLFLTVHLEN